MFVDWFDIILPIFHNITFIYYSSPFYTTIHSLCNSFNNVYMIHSSSTQSYYYKLETVQTYSNVNKYSQNLWTSSLFVINIWNHIYDSNTEYSKPLSNTTHNSIHNPKHSDNILNTI